ncbi:hypothetical protein MTR67_013169 [Solanum verrucosum]|uniref:Uncharacterized protein n=1 Tax=Solanum verrucosum TaxID=315347 RepID=A0AAF0Q9Y7_SOLVR|nr:hypothetical protein MTR67_013169 [Solanum verrucosum]
MDRHEFKVVSKQTRNSLKDGSLPTGGAKSVETITREVEKELGRTPLRNECRSISSEEISLLILSGNFLAITLVDQYKLSHSWLDVCASDLCIDTPNYTGHYIVICGYDTDADEFEIRDPASSRSLACEVGSLPTAYLGLELGAKNKALEIWDGVIDRWKYGRVTSKCLEKARKSFGTDEDLLLIRVEREEAKCSHHDHGDHCLTQLL